MPSNRGLDELVQEDMPLVSTNGNAGMVGAIEEFPIGDGETRGIDGKRLKRLRKAVSYASFNTAPPGRRVTIQR